MGSGITFGGMDRFFLRDGGMNTFFWRDSGMRAFFGGMAGWRTSPHKHTPSVPPVHVRTSVSPMSRIIRPIRKFASVCSPFLLPVRTNPLKKEQTHIIENVLELFFFPRKGGK